MTDLPRIHDSRGNLSFVQDNDQIPFSIRRVYFLYDVPAGSKRGGHAHKHLDQFIIPVAGSFDVALDDGLSKKVVSLNRPYQGLHIPSMIWRELRNFSAGAVSLVLASEAYDEDDYYRIYSEFKRAVRRL